MRTLIQGGGIYTPASDAATYNPLWGNYNWLTDQVGFYQVIPCDGKLSDLYVWTRGGTGVGKTRTFSLYKNGGTTLLSAVMDVLNIAEDVTHEVSVSAGDLICMEHVPAETPDVYECLWCVIFTATTTGESLVLGCSRWGADGELGGTQYASCGIGGQRLANNTSYFREVIPTDGKFSALYVALTAAPDPGGSDGYTFTLEVNGVASALAVTITGDDTTGNAASDIDLSPGDIVQLKITESGTPSATPHARWGLKWVPDISGEGIVLGCTYDPPGDTDTVYITPTTHSTSTFALWTPSRCQPVWEATIKKFYVVIGAAPGAGKSRTFTIRRRTRTGDEDDTTITIPIADAAVSGNDTTHEHSADDYDQIVIKTVPSGTPAGNQSVGWGYVVELPELAPAGGGGNPTDVLVKNALI